MGYYERQRLQGFQGTNQPAHFWTNAPESYDYNYVRTVRTISGKHHGPWRYIEVTDRDRFKDFQTPRYRSGMYIVVVPGSDDADYHGLEGGLGPEGGQRFTVEPGPEVGTVVITDTKTRRKRKLVYSDFSDGHEMGVSEKAEEYPKYVHAQVLKLDKAHRPRMNQIDYVFYVVDPDDLSIWTGWSYRDDAREAMREMAEDAREAGFPAPQRTVYTGKHLRSKGINPDEDSNWQGGR